MKSNACFMLGNVSWERILKIPFAHISARSVCEKSIQQGDHSYLSFIISYLFIICSIEVVFISISKSFTLNVSGTVAL